jgi:hypothetical protein
MKHAANRSKTAVKTKAKTLTKVKAVTKTKPATKLVSKKSIAKSVLSSRGQKPAQTRQVNSQKIIGGKFKALFKIDS